MEVIGIKVVNFQDKVGKTVKGVKLFFTDDSVLVAAGVACDSLFLSSFLLDKFCLTPADFNVGDRLTVSYNKYGKIQAVSVN